MSERATPHPRGSRKRPEATPEATREDLAVALHRRDAILHAVSTAAERFLRARPMQKGMVAETLALLGEAAEVDRVYVFENHHGEDGTLLTSQRYEWNAPGVTSQDDNPDNRDFPWRGGGMERWAGLLSRGETVRGNLRDFPESERAVLEPQGILSIVVVPVVVTGQWWGFIGFDACRHERAWSAAEVEALRAAGAILGAQIERRTTEQALHHEYTERKRAEEALRKHRERLEALVGERTAEIRRAQQALRESEARLRTAIESLPFDFFIIDADGRYAVLNTAARNHWGDIAGLRPEDVAPNEALRALWTSNNARAFAGEIIREEVEFPGDEPRIVENIIAPIRDGECVAGILGVNIDVTERRRAEEDKQRLEDRLRRAHKMEAVGTLAGGIAHDFNNLLMGIQGYTSLMLCDVEAGHPHHYGLRNIEHLVQSGAELTSRLLGYARKGKVETRPLDLNALARRVSDTVGRARKEMRVRLDLAEELPAIEADAGQIEQVLLNLLINAADAMPDGGEIRIRTRATDGKDLKAPGDPPRAQGYVRLTVTDTGHGMDPGTLERIFDPFFTTKDKGRGTGLGLASVYGIVETHGGVIDVESKPGSGTRFHVLLPASDRTADPELQVAAARDTGHGTILLVDDEPLVLDAGRRMLQQLGYEVLAAPGGLQALSLFEQHKDRIDMVLLDVVMPDMGGKEVFERLRAERPDLRVLLASGYSSGQRIDEILDRGAVGFLQKPFDLHELSRHIRAILEPGEGP